MAAAHALGRGLRFHSTLQAVRIRVGYTQGAGRGVFATRDIADGEVIHTADPIVAHPSLTSLHKKGMQTFIRNHHMEVQRMKMWIDAQPFSAARAVRIRQRSVSMWMKVQVFYSLEKQADWSDLHMHCRAHCLRFPLVAKRLACMVASAAASPHVLDILSYVRLPLGIPAIWRNERQILLKALQSKSAQPQSLDYEWYAGVISRLHLNAFRVERIHEQDSRDLLAAAAASVAGEGIVGTAIYVLPSMYNHDCDPNVNIVWPNNVTANLVARRSIMAGEELRITYIDASMPWDVRRSVLEDAYGFVCECPRCKEQD